MPPQPPDHRNPERRLTNGPRKYRQGATEAKLAEKLEKVRERPAAPSWRPVAEPPLVSGHAVLRELCVLSPIRDLTKSYQGRFPTGTSRYSLIAE